MSLVFYVYNYQKFYNQALIDFKWLDKDEMVQQTGINMIANFNEDPVKINNINIPAKGVIALLKDGSIMQFISPDIKISRKYYSN